MSRRRTPATSAPRAASHPALDRITLHAFMFTLTVATAVALSYGPGAALHHIIDVLAAAGTSPVDPPVWQGTVAY